MEKMPHWADVILVPLISLLLAALISALVILGIGEDPVAALVLMVKGSLGSTYGWGYTLYYATNFIFTGLCVSVAFHARLFNIGGEGQALLGGLGVALACLYIPWPHWTVAVLGAGVAAALFGAALVKAQRDETGVSAPADQQARPHMGRRAGQQTWQRAGHKQPHTPRRQPPRSVRAQARHRRKARSWHRRKAQARHGRKARCLRRPDTRAPHAAQAS